MFGGKKVYVLDASALIHSNTMQIYDKQCYITPSVASEVLDNISRLMLDIGIERGSIKVVEPEKKFLEMAKEYAISTGDIAKLSQQDLSVIALALQLRESGYDPIVITDDYSIMNVLVKAGIKYESIRFRKLGEYREWVVYCPACGATFKQNVNYCPYCGHTVIKRKPKSRKKRKTLK